MGGTDGERESEADSVLSAESNLALDGTTLRSQPEPKIRDVCLTSFTA